MIIKRQKEFGWAEDKTMDLVSRMPKKRYEKYIDLADNLKEKKRILEDIEKTSGKNSKKYSLAFGEKLRAERAVKNYAKKEIGIYTAKKAAPLIIAGGAAIAAAAAIKKKKEDKKK